MLLQTCVKEFSFNLRGHHPSYPLHDEVYLIQHYVIKFASHLRQIGGFLWVIRFPPPIKLTTMKYLKYC